LCPLTWKYVFWKFLSQGGLLVGTLRKAALDNTVAACSWTVIDREESRVLSAFAFPPSVGLPFEHPRAGVLIGQL